MKTTPQVITSKQATVQVNRTIKSKSQFKGSKVQEPAQSWKQWIAQKTMQGVYVALKASPLVAAFCPNMLTYGLAAANGVLSMMEAQDGDTVGLLHAGLSIAAMTTGGVVAAADFMKVGPNTIQNTISGQQIGCSAGNNFYNNQSYFDPFIQTNVNTECILGQPTLTTSLSVTNLLPANAVLMPSQYNPISVQNCEDAFNACAQNYTAPTNWAGVSEPVVNGNVINCSSSDALYYTKPVYRPYPGFYVADACLSTKNVPLGDPYYSLPHNYNSASDVPTPQTNYTSNDNGGLECASTRAQCDLFLQPPTTQPPTATQGTSQATSQATQATELPITLDSGTQKPTSNTNDAAIGGALGTLGAVATGGAVAGLAAYGIKKGCKRQNRIANGTPIQNPGDAFIELEVIKEEEV